MQKPNEKLLSFVIILLWEVISVHFYNWDRPLNLVLVMYDLIELIIEASLWSMDYSTFDTHTQHTRLCSDNAYLICVIVHVQWDVCVLNHMWIKPKRFLFFLFALEVICITHVFQNFLSCFCEKNMCSGCFSWLISWVSSTGS